jgi:hypothetical protein
VRRGQGDAGQGPEPGSDVTDRRMVGERRGERLLKRRAALDQLQ